MRGLSAVMTQGRRYSAHIALGAAWLAVILVAPNLRPTGPAVTRSPAAPVATGAPVSTPAAPTATAPAADPGATSVPFSDFIVDAAPTEMPAVEEPRDDTLAPPPAEATAPAATADAPAEPEPPATPPGPTSGIPAPALPPVPPLPNP
ncbi:MAG TPA: hypothetical protein VM030_03425 [Acidimicrobiales bacterium]|nr:hypothetical protein [Acidimicrobiales bacterium]